MEFERWTRSEALDYFDWFMTQIDQRIRTLSTAIHGSDVGSDCMLDGTPDSLLCLGEVLLAVTATRPSTAQERAAEASLFPEHLSSTVVPEGWELTEATLSVVVDVGIYFAETLRRAHPSLAWVLWTRRTVDFQRPVIVPFRGGVPLDPIRISGNIALQAARGGPDRTRLRELFDYWGDRVE